MHADSTEIIPVKGDIELPHGLRQDEQPVQPGMDALFAIKPMFYANSGGTLTFGSEIKAVLAAGKADTGPVLRSKTS